MTKTQKVAFRWLLDMVFANTSSARDYTLAVAKFTLGEARSKFTTIAGPQGGGQLNGDALKAEAQNEMQILDQQIGNYQEGGTPLSFTIG